MGTVREAGPADAPRIATVHEAAIRGLAGDTYDSTVVDAWAGGVDPDGYPVESDDSHLVVAERDTTIVGYGELRPRAGDYLQSAVDGEIRAVYVHPDHAREGVGSAIYEALESAARNRDLDSLGLWASLNAVQFYEAQGFEQVARVTHAFGGDTEGPAVEMRKLL